jgi:hypothetical protein
VEGWIMELHEKIEEDIIKQENYNRKNHVSLSYAEQRENMLQNWMECFDENGNKYYEPLFYHDPDADRKPKQEDPSFLKILVVVLFGIFEFLFIFMIVFFNLT